MLDGLEDRREQTWEAGLEVVVAQRVDTLGPLLALPDDPGLPQDLEMVSHRRFGHRVREAPATALPARLGKFADDPEPDGIAEGVEHALEVDLVAFRVRDHAWIVRHLPYFATMFDKLRTRRTHE